MPAFSRFDRDIDDTKIGAPYVVDSDGWGWFFLSLIVAIPFLLTGVMIVAVSRWIAQNYILCAIAYVIVSISIGAMMYLKSNVKHRVLGILASAGTMFPFGIVAATYAIPMIVIEGTFSAVFDWVLVASLMFIVTFFVIKICGLLKNGLLHLIVATIFILLGIVFAIALINSESILTWENIHAVYTN